MGLLGDKQLKYYSDLSTGLISLDGDLTTLVTINNNISAVGTRISATEVNFQITNHAQYGAAIGKFIKTSGYAPAAYNITGVILSLPDADNIRVTPLSDPITDDTTTGVVDFGSFNINHNGKYRIVSKPSLYSPESNIRDFIAKNNIDHSAVASDGNIIIYVDIDAVIKAEQLTSGSALLDAYEAADIDYNDSLQIGIITKQDDSVFAFEPVATWRGNNGSRLNNVLDFMPTVRSQTKPPIVSAVGGNLQLKYNSGTNLIPNLGFEATGGVNPDQLITLTSNPVLIILGARDNIIQSASNDLDVNNYESSPGVTTFKGVSKASNNFILGLQPFVVQLLGQVLYSGANPEITASQANEAVDNPAISRFAARMINISVVTAETDLDSTFTIFKDLSRYD